MGLRWLLGVTAPAQTLTVEGASVPDMDPNRAADPPESLEAATELFREFLLSQNYPTQITWIAPTDVLVGFRDCRFLVDSSGAAGTEYAQNSYATGLARGLGIAMIALCASDRSTFATVVVPDDETDRQRRLMRKGLKLSIPLDRRKCLVVTSPLRWKILVSQYAKRSQPWW